MIFFKFWNAAKPYSHCQSHDFSWKKKHWCSALYNFVLVSNRKHFCVSASVKYLWIFKLNTADGIVDHISNIRGPLHKQILLYMGDFYAMAPSQFPPINHVLYNNLSTRNDTSPSLKIIHEFISNFKITPYITQQVTMTWCWLCISYFFTSIHHIFIRLYSIITTRIVFFNKETIYKETSVCELQSTYIFQLYIGRWDFSEHFNFRKWQTGRFLSERYVESKKSSSYGKIPKITAWEKINHDLSWGVSIL